MKTNLYKLMALVTLFVMAFSMFAQVADNIASASACQGKGKCSDPLPGNGKACDPTKPGKSSDKNPHCPDTDTNGGGNGGGGNGGGGNGGGVIPPVIITVNGHRFIRSEKSALACARHAAFTNDINTTSDVIEVAADGTVQNLTADSGVDFFNVAAHDNGCLLAHQVSDHGNYKVIITDAKMVPVSEIDLAGSYGEPDFSSGNSLFVVNLTDQLIVKTDIWTKDYTPVVHGSYPDSRMVAGNKYELVFTTVNGTAGFIWADGTIHDSGIKATRCNWVDAGHAMCNSGKGLFTIDSATLIAGNSVADEWGASVQNPDDPTQLLTATFDGLYLGTSENPTAQLINVDVTAANIDATK